MLEFQLPWVFYCLPLPLFIYLLIPRVKVEQAAVRVPFFQTLEQLQQQTSLKMAKQPFKIAGALLIWCSLISAAAQPTWIGDPISLPTEGRDLMLAVDLSKSMLMEDMDIGNEKVNRLIAVKAVVSEFIEQRVGDRIGMILFGTQAYIQAPLSFDTKTVQRFLMESQIGFAGDATAIGDAIGLAVKRLRKRPGNQHVLILSTDGANTAGEVKPLAAAKFAAEHNITIYTIGVGADELVQPGIFGSSWGARKINPSADLDEDTLQKISALTGGQYFRAKNPTELSSIYQIVNELEPIEDKALTFRPSKSLFHWPLAIALLTSFLSAFLALPWKEWLSTHTLDEERTQ